MLGIGEADEFKVEFRSLFVFAGAVNVARSEVVLVGIAVFVGAADMSVAQDEIGLGLSRYPSRVGCGVNKVTRWLLRRSRMVV